MNKAYSIIRVCILLIIGCAGTLFLFGEEQDNSFFAYLFHLILDKALGFLLLALTIFLFNKWRKQGKVLAYKRPGKVEYRTADLRLLQRIQQDYLEK